MSLFLLLVGLLFAVAALVWDWPVGGLMTYQEKADRFGRASLVILWLYFLVPR